MQFCDLIQIASLSQKTKSVLYDSCQNTKVRAQSLLSWLICKLCRVKLLTMKHLPVTGSDGRGVA